MYSSTKENLKDAKWLKVSELAPGMQIAVCDQEISDGVVWDEIVSIESKGREHVYDIEVEGTHNFVAGHLLRPASEIALSSDKRSPCPLSEEEEKETLSQNTADGSLKLPSDIKFGGIVAHNTYIGGNLGIGTTSPYAKLSVVGETVSAYFTATTTATSTFAGGIQTNLLRVTSATATSTFSNGIELTAGCFRLPDNTCAGAGGGSGTVGTASLIGQIPYYAAASNVLTATSSIFIATNQYVGIGTTTPRSILNIADTRPQLTLTDTSTYNSHWFMSSQGGNFYVGTSSDSLNATTTYLTINNGGNVGIGTTEPTVTLDVTGSIRASGYLQTPIIYGWNSLNFRTYDGAAWVNAMTLAGSGNVGIGTSTPNWNLQIASSTKTRLALSDMSAGSNLKHWLLSSMGGNLYIGTSSDTYATGTISALTINSNGYLGIGSSSPSQQLSVAGLIYASGSGTSTLAGGLNVLALNVTGTATSTFANGIQLTNGCFRGSDGNCAGSGSGSGTVGASTAIGQMPYYAAVGTTLTATSTLFIHTNSYVGIGTTTPQTALHIGTASTTQLTSFHDSLMVSGELEVAESAYFGPMEFPTDSGAVSWVNMPVSTTVATGTIESYTAQLGGTDVLTIYGTAYGYLGGATSTAVGIGTTSPFALLSVQGSVGSTQTVFAVATTTYAGVILTAFMIDSAGNIGIGTTTPSSNATVGQKIVLSNTASTSIIIGRGAICVDNDGGCIATTTGRVSARHFNTAGSDVAEQYKSDEALEAGDIVMAKVDRLVGKAKKVFPEALLGVVSSEAGLTLGPSYELDGQEATIDQYPVALAGRALVNVSTEGGEIAAGDKITISSLDGIGMRAVNSGKIVGMALESFDSAAAVETAMVNSREVKIGKVLIFINLGYDRMPPVIVSGSPRGIFSDLDSIAYNYSSASAPAVSIDESGKVGIGTTSPAYKLEVAGDIGANAFINISTEQAKKDINFLSDADYETILGQIASTNVATYGYRSDMTNKTYMGLIAEEAPREILSVDGQGVDLYKMSSFLWAGVKAQQKQINELADEIIQIKEKIGMTLGSEGEIPTSGEGTEGTVQPSALMAAVSDIFNQMGLAFDQGVIKIRNLAVDFLQVRKLAVDVTPDDANNSSGLRRDPTIGSSQINPGETAIYIANNQVSTSSKIFITAERPVALGLCLKNQATSTVDGLIQPPGFKVCLNQPAGETIKFDWWIIDAIDNSQQATSPPVSPDASRGGQPSPLQGEGAGEVSGNTSSASSSETPSASPSVFPDASASPSIEPSISPSPFPEPSASPTPSEGPAPTETPSASPSPSSEQATSPPASPDASRGGQPSPLQGEGAGEVSPSLSPEPVPIETPTPSPSPSASPSESPTPSETPTT